MSNLDGANFDSVTGQELPDVQEQKQEEAARKAIEDMQHLVSLANHPGWKRIRDLLTLTIAEENKGLLHASHIDMIRHYQARIKARTDLLGWLEMKIHEGKTILDERDQKGPGTKSG